MNKAHLEVPVVRGMADFATPEIFWIADNLGPVTNWVGHVPFAFWLIGAHRPRLLVELGTHAGTSYFAFCQAVKRMGLVSACYAVDTWCGDEHSGFYGEEVFTELSRYHDPLYSGFSRLVRSTFDEAVGHFADGVVDLLHIDGLHTYDAVKQDFENWFPKLSDRAVVLFHDINVRERGFGVWRLWEELSERYPSFQFLHSHGLGVLAVGSLLPERVKRLFAAGDDPALTRQVRDQFSRLGALMLTEQRLASAEAELAEKERLRGDAERRAAAEQERAVAAEERLAGLRAYVAGIEEERETLRRERNAVLSSTFWRLTGPARRILAAMPPGLRRHVRGAARLSNWLLTPHRTWDRTAYLPADRGHSAVASTAVAPLATRHAPAEPPHLASFFDAEWYVRRYGDVADTGLTPFDHFLTRGMRDLRDPNPAFDTAWYLEAYPDVGRQYLPIEHFVRCGAEEGRRPFWDFDFEFYRELRQLNGASNLEIYRDYLMQRQTLSSSPMQSDGGGSVINLDQWRDEINLVGGERVLLDRPVGVFVHLFYDDLAEEIAAYLARIDIPKKIYVSTDTEEKRAKISRDFELAGIAPDAEIAIVPNYGADISPMVIQFREKLTDHDICLKIHGKKSVHLGLEFGNRWRKHLYEELMGGAERVRAIIATLLAHDDLGMLLAQHFFGVEEDVGIGPNYEPMREILAQIDVDLSPDQQIEFPSGSMFWFRGEVLIELAQLGLDWIDFGPDLRQPDGTLAHGMERCLLFFCAKAGKKWALLPRYRPSDSSMLTGCDA